MSKHSRWKIFRANLDPIVGSEQGKTRPVLIISRDEINELLNCVNIVPITTRKSGRTIYPNEVLLPKGTAKLENESIALCHQMRTIDKRRLSFEYGEVKENAIRVAILEALKFQLDIE